MRKIKLTRGKYALVDDEDFEYLNQWKWYAHIRGYVIRDIQVDRKHKKILMHRVILNPPEDKVVDHINSNPLDNRRVNLKVCTQSENLLKKRIQTNNKSGVIGVCWIPARNMWLAQLSFKRKKLLYSFFDNKEEAINAYSLLKKQC